MSVKFTILGCGSSLGVPRIDGSFGKCNSKIKKNYRTRCSALISINNFNVLIDTSPDIKYQLIKNNIKSIDKVFYTHLHADQTHGINELRLFYLKNKKKIDIYADNKTSKYLKNSFKYCFVDGFIYPSTLKLNKLKKKHIYKFDKKKIVIENFPVEHGNIKSSLYIINKSCAYASDVSKIFKKDINKLKRIKYFVLDCLRYDQHPSHFNLDGVLNLIDIIKPKKTILTNMNSDIDYLQIKKMLPKNIIPAYDGMSFLI
tara:strand:- start:2274 stop:3047 length:774 start_codon:yes stop_codon:yes gene_type:complete